MAAADGGTTGRVDTASIGMIAAPVLAALLAIALGFAGADMAAALEPLVDALLEGVPEVGGTG